MSNKTLAHLSLFAVALIYGANYTIAKEVMNNGYIQPLGFILMRAGSATLLFWIFHGLFIKEKIQTAHYPLLALCGLLGVAINQMLFFSGLELSKPINAALLMTTIPIIVIISASILTDEKITKRKVLGISIGALGAILLISYGKDVSFSRTGLKGDIMLFLNASSYGVYLVLVKKLMKIYNPITILKWVFTFGLVFIIPFGWNQAVQINWSSFPVSIWLAFFYVLLFTTFLAYLFNAFALKHVNPSVVGIYVYLQPLLATAIALMAQKDEVTVIKVVSGVLIFIGVYFVSSSRQQEMIKNDVTN